MVESRAEHEVSFPPFCCAPPHISFPRGKQSLVSTLPQDVCVCVGGGDWYRLQFYNKYSACSIGLEKETFENPKDQVSY